MPEIRIPREPGDDDDEPLPDLFTRRSAEPASKPDEKQEEKRPEPRTRPPGRWPRFARWAATASAPPPGGFKQWLVEQKRKEQGR